MEDILSVEIKIKQIIDELKGLCQTNGLSNQASEEVVITSIFLYKFLNDKFMYNLKEFSKEIKMPVDKILENKNYELDGFYDTYSSDVAFTYDETIECLINRINSDTFYKTFDDALERISNNTRNEIFRVETAEGKRNALFTRITENVEASKRNNFAKNIFGIIGVERFDFSSVFKNNFDFYSTIFEYLIKDYNVASGVYAEYFTPQAISKVIANILVNMSNIEDKIYDVYDPSAGSGSLVLHLANSLGKGSFGDKARVYTQDISGKSSRFLRINMLLNGLTSSLPNIIEGDTLDTPAHYNVEHDQTSGIKQFDFITSNPPFKMDFSSTRNSIIRKWDESEEHDGLRRFFARIPEVPKKNKKKMPIYLCFIQHILWSLKENGKAAIVVPTGFLTAQSKIENKIRETIIERHWLKGAISMPSNIFANTGTNVSVLFIDKSNKKGNIILIDASNLGKKVKDGNNQKTVLNDDETKKIEDTFIKQKQVDDFSVKVSYEDIKEKDYNLSAGPYFEIKIEHIDITKKEFDKKMKEYENELTEMFDESKKLNKEIIQNIAKIGMKS